MPIQAAPAGPSCVRWGWGPRRRRHTAGAPPCGQSCASCGAATHWHPPVISAVPNTGSLEEGRADLVARLRSRAPELGETVFAHVRNVVSDPAAESDARFI